MEKISQRPHGGILLRGIENYLSKLKISLGRFQSLL